jgi:hypothetical protein
MKRRRKKKSTLLKKIVSKILSTAPTPGLRPELEAVAQVALVATASLEVFVLEATAQAEAEARLVRAAAAQVAAQVAA